MRSRASVCLIIERIAGRSGGAERIMIELANWLAARGHPVRIVSYERRRGDPFYPLAFGVSHSNLRRPDGVRGRARVQLDELREQAHGLRRLPSPLRRLQWLSKHGGFERALARDLALHRPDVAVAFLTPAIVALGRIEVPPGVRRVASVHNVPRLDLASPERWDPSPLDVARRMPAAAAHDAITVLLDEFRDWFPPDLRERVVVMPNPVPPAAPAEGRREKLVASVGRLADVKRHDLLVRAWARLAADFPDWRLEIYGVGPDRATLEREIARSGAQQSIALKGHVKDIESVYRRASILAHPAAYEGWGLAVTEALAHGLPAIGFRDCPGVNRLIDHEATGLLVPAETDPEGGFERALRRLMEDEALRARLGAAGPASMARFAPEKVRAIWARTLFPDEAGAEG